MSVTALDPARLWVEFTDPADPERRYRCDLTWLTSRWTCIYGRGCRSIVAAVPDGGCCVLGAHFAGPDLARVAAVVEHLDEQTWQHHPGSTAVEAWTEREGDATKTKVVDDACIFLNRDGFPTGAGCAMHHLAERTGQTHVETMPDACWQLPTRRTHQQVQRPDGTAYLEVTITEHDRRGFGPGWRELDWYCTDNAEAHVGRQPLFREIEAELVALMGPLAYEELVRHAEAHLETVKAARQHGMRQLLPLLVHPATQAARPVTTPPPPPPRSAAKARKAKRRR